MIYLPIFFLTTHRCKHSNLALTNICIFYEYLKITLHESESSAKNAKITTLFRLIFRIERNCTKKKNYTLDRYIENIF